MRLFIAIDFGKEKEFFEKIQERVDTGLLKAKFTKSYHLTLKFLGEVNQEKIEEIKKGLESIEFNPFEVIIDKIGFFPNENYVKVIWIGLEDNEKVIELQKKVEQALSKMFRKDNRFHPHITLARVKFIKDKEGFRKNMAGMKFEPKKFKISEFKLIKSTLTGEGPVYEDLAEFEGKPSRI